MTDFPRSVEDIASHYASRRAGMLKALTDGEEEGESGYPPPSRPPRLLSLASLRLTRGTTRSSPSPVRPATSCTSASSASSTFARRPRCCDTSQSSRSGTRQVDGKKNRVYCQNLCLLSKLFLDHKTLYYDVDPFLFYVLCEVDADGYHMVGYFSKEKSCQDNYNLACILTLPAYQRKGYGKFLISLAYCLSHLEGKPGTAERPLSDLGAVSFRSYWTRQVLDALRDCKGEVTVQAISDRTMMMPQDIMDTLKALNLLSYWKGQHFIAAPAKVVDDYWRMFNAPGGRWLEVDIKCLHWQPLTPGAARNTNK